MSDELYPLIRRIHIESKRLAREMLMGAYRSAFKGSGMEFDEEREYVNGDDIDKIDWNVTARMNHPYVKVFREERELSILFLVDVSLSMSTGSGSLIKKQKAAEVAALLAFSALHNHDRVGLLLFSDRVEKYIPPKSNLRHVLRILREILGIDPKGRTTNIASALSYVGKVIVKPAICFVISDFFSEPFSRPAEIVARKHDLIAISIQAVQDQKLVPIGLSNWVDPETGVERVVDTSNEVIREQFAAEAAEHRKNTIRLFNKIGGSWLEIPDGKPLVPIIRKFFKMRGKHPK